MKKHLLLLALSCAAFLPVSAQTLQSVQEVYKIFQAKCISCHDHASPAGNLDLEGTGASELARAQNVASKLVNINPTNTFAVGNGLKRVYPGRLDRSFLFKKINQGLEPTIAALHASEGDAMPQNAPALSSVEKEIIRQWILFGAKSTGVQFNKSVVETYYNVGGEASFPDGPPPAPAQGEGFQIKMGPFFLAPDGEVEYYQKWELNLPAAVEVKSIDFKISPFSHHFLLYNFTGNGAAAIPAGLRLNSLHNQINLVAAVQEATELKLPETTAFFWPNNLVLDLNSHYINYSLSKPFMCEAYINVYTQPVGTAEQEMHATLLINPDIPIPNNSDEVMHSASEFQPGADSIYIWGLMGHTHKYGTDYKVWKRLSNGQKGEMIYDASCPMGLPGCPVPNFDYRHIPIRYWEPLLPLKWGNGIIHEAKWINDGPSPVNFGPTSDDEMMVLIAFYTDNPLTLDVNNPDAPLFGAALRVAPNPATGLATFSLPESVDKLRQFRLFDASGREVRRLIDVQGPSFEVSVAGLPAGMYAYVADGFSGKLMIGKTNE